VSYESGDTSETAPTEGQDYASEVSPALTTEADTAVTNPTTPYVAPSVPPTTPYVAVAPVVPTTSPCRGRRRKRSINAARR
jgi:hypothetical protein